MLGIIVEELVRECIGENGHKVFMEEHDDEAGQDNIAEDREATDVDDSSDTNISESSGFGSEELMEDSGNNLSEDK